MRRIICAIFVAASVVSGPDAAAGQPNGTFANQDGVLELEYLGEGTVRVELRTKYCRIESSNAGTFVPEEGIHVYGPDGKPLLVIFYSRKKAIVWAELDDFKERHCKKGSDATGVYRRKK